LGWAGGIFYTVAQTTVCIWMITANPGYFDADGSDEAYLAYRFGPFERFVTAVNSIWSALILVSTVLTIYAVFRIFQTTSILSANNPNVNVSNVKMVLHSSLLVVQFPIIVAVAILYKYPKIAVYSNGIMPIVDMVIQLLIGYICWTMGSSK
jgi:hypothetical protein